MRTSGCDHSGMIRPPRHRRSVALVVAALLAAGLVGCGGGSGEEAALDPAQLRQKIDAQPVSYIHTLTDAVDDEGTVRVADVKMLVERETESVKSVIAPNEFTGVPGQTQVTVGPTMYIQIDGGGKWTRLDMGSDLVGQMTPTGGQPTVTDLFGFIDGDMRYDGTEDQDGQDYKRYEGAIDWSAYLEATEGTGDLLRGMWEQLPTDVEMDFTVTVLVDDAGEPHQYVLGIDMDQDGEQGQVVAETTFPDTDGVEPIEAPDETDVGETVKVNSMDEMQQAISGAMEAG